MRVVMVSKALVVGAYQRKAEEIARHGVELTVLTPPSWRDARGAQQAERLHTQGYELATVPVRRNGHFHTHFYPTLARELRQRAPHVLHMDEEPYNFATWHGLCSAGALGIRSTFFTWQNIHKRYPPPFAWFERDVLHRAPVAIAGNAEAEGVLRAKGYRGDVALIPQFGVDPEIFRPAAHTDAPRPFTIGYAGGLLPEKGIDLLLQACAHLPGDWRLRLAGEGSAQAELVALAQTLGIADRVAFEGRMSSGAMSTFYHGLDVFVLPSRTTPRWKEQFGRVLIEAMACGVPVVGSHSGEIPHVIGDAGLVFPEGDAAALNQHLTWLAADAAHRAALAEQGRARVLAHFTMAQIARRTVEVYEALCTSP
jgi:glycosyltransferase involved in cell wall biosynthesis